MTKNLLVGLAVLVIIVAAIFYIRQKRTTQSKPDLGAEKTTTAAQLGKQAPGFKLESLDGKKLALSDFRGKPVVLNFWATWCPFCLAEMSDFEQIHREFAEKVVFIGINRAEDKKTAQDFAQKTGVSYLMLLDPADSVASAYRIVSMPTTYIMDSTGKIIDQRFGQMTAEELREKLKSIVPLFLNNLP